VKVRHHGERIFAILSDCEPSTLTTDQFQRFTEAVEHHGPDETIPEKISVAEILKKNERRWLEGPVSHAEANEMEAAGLRAMNEINRTFWEGGSR